jgi:hypothetical protein
VSIARLRDRAAPPSRAARVLRRHEADEAHDTRGRRKATRITQFGRNGQCAEITDPRKHRNRRTDSAKGSLVK